MFKIVKERHFTNTVRVQVPVDGGHKVETLKATYRVLDTNQIEPFDLTTTGGSTEFLRAAIVRLDDLVEENGEPAVYSDELRDQLLCVPFVRTALADAYFKSVNKARSGN